jgi:hypothetical protein
MATLRSGVVAFSNSRRMKLLESVWLATREDEEESTKGDESSAVLIGIGS